MNAPSGAGNAPSAMVPLLGPALSRPLADARRPQGEGGSAAALGEVAARLERIAAGLRRGSLAELLARAESEEAEPLEVLITGYALGYAEALRRSR